MKYKQHEAQDDGYSDWIKPNMKLYKLSCCDCGLVHNLVFEIEDDYVIFKAARNERATGQMRRWLNVKKD